jgi:succinate-acetate transporter protein
MKVFLKGFSSRSPEEAILLCIKEVVQMNTYIIASTIFTLLAVGALFGDKKTAKIAGGLAVFVAVIALLTI